MPHPEGMTVELLAIIVPELGRHPCPASESWQYTSFLYQLKTICIWYLDGTDEKKSNANDGSFDDLIDDQSGYVQPSVPPVDGMQYPPRIGRLQKLKGLLFA